jgi:hypothetical protein
LRIRISRAVAKPAIPAPITAIERSSVAFGNKVSSFAETNSLQEHHSRFVISSRECELEIGSNALPRMGIYLRERRDMSVPELDGFKADLSLRDRKFHFKILAFS